MESHYIPVNESYHHKYYEFNRDFKELTCKDKDKPRKICCVYKGLNQPIYLWEIVDDNHYHDCVWILKFDQYINIFGSAFISVLQEL